MKLIVGLGNPGRIYIHSRHNIGFSVVKALAKAYKVSFKRESATFSLSAKCKVRSQNIILAMPLTFMNLSGLAVAALLKKYKIVLDDLLVVCDNLDLGLGRLKVRAAGSSGGHKGLQSIIDALKTDRFARMRIGIGRPHPNIETSVYVMSAFGKDELALKKDIIEKASDCCRVWATEGIAKSMSIFNRKG